MLSYFLFFYEGEDENELMRVDFEPSDPSTVLVGDVVRAYYMSFRGVSENVTFYFKTENEQQEEVFVELSDFAQAVPYFEEVVIVKVKRSSEKITSKDVQVDTATTKTLSTPAATVPTPFVQCEPLEEIPLSPPEAPVPPMPITSSPPAEFRSLNDPVQVANGILLYKREAPEQGRVVFSFEELEFDTNYFTENGNILMRDSAMPGTIWMNDRFAIAIQPFKPEEMPFTAAQHNKMEDLQKQMQDWRLQMSQKTQLVREQMASRTQEAWKSLKEATDHNMKLVKIKYQETKEKFTKMTSGKEEEVASAAVEASARTAERDKMQGVSKPPIIKPSNNTPLSNSAGPVRSEANSSVKTSVLSHSIDAARKHPVQAAKLASAVSRT